MKKDMPDKCQQNKSGVAILISNKAELKAKILNKKR